MTSLATRYSRLAGAILLPFANRIRGKVSADGKTVTADVAGKTVTLAANWSGNNPGAEKHAIHGLMLRSKFRRRETEEGGRRFKGQCRLARG